MQKATDRYCLLCRVRLSTGNWAPEQKANWTYKCKACLRLEKREYGRKWSALNREKTSAASKRHKQKLRSVDPVRARARAAYSDCRKRALKMGAGFDLTPEFVLNLMREAVKCPYFGWELTFQVGKERTLASIDRIDSCGGYTKNNVQIVSYLANLMKSYATEEEMLLFARGVIRMHDTHVGMLGLGGLRTVEKVKGAEGNR